MTSSPGASELGGRSSSSSGVDLELDHSLAEETYTSSLFQTEPLYQFYDKELLLKKVTYNEYLSTTAA